MNQKEKVLTIILIIVLIISVGLTYYRTLIQKNFEVINVEPEEDIFNNE